MKPRHWDLAEAATLGAVLGPSSLLAVWLSSMVPWPSDALTTLACFFGGVFAGAALCAGAAAIGNALARRPA